MYGTRDAASKWERDWQGHLASWGYELGTQSKQLVPQQEKENFRFDTRRRFCGDRNEGSPLELKKQLESLYPIKARTIGAGSTKSIKALNRRRCWAETGILYQYDPRHVDVLVESLELETGNTVQTLVTKDVKD